MGTNLLFRYCSHKLCLFRLFRYRSETPKLTAKNFWVLQKNKPKNNRNRLSFGLFWFEPRKNFNCFEDPLIEKVFGRFFWFVSFCIHSYVCFVCFDSGPKNRNKPKKMFFDFTKQTEKQPKQIEFRFVSDRTEKKIWLFRGHPMQKSEKTNSKLQ
jgi:hypothetical protein